MRFTGEFNNVCCRRIWFSDSIFNSFSCNLWYKMKSIRKGVSQESMMFWSNHACRKYRHENRRKRACKTRSQKEIKNLCISLFMLLIFDSASTAFFNLSSLTLIVSAHFLSASSILFSREVTKALKTVYKFMSKKMLQREFASYYLICALATHVHIQVVLNLQSLHLIFSIISKKSLTCMGVKYMRNVELTVMIIVSSP